MGSGAYDNFGEAFSLEVLLSEVLNFGGGNFVDRLYGRFEKRKGQIVADKGTDKVGMVKRAVNLIKH
jgi:hypothetical protein